MSLLAAIQEGDAPRVKKLIDGGADVNELGEGGETPLIAAAAAGELPLVRRLLDAGADPGLADASGESALLKAAAAGHRRVVELLSPHASADERDTAAAYLRAAAKSEVSGEVEGPAGEPASRLRTRLVQATARAAKFFGDEHPSERVDRVSRAEKNRKR